MPTIKLTAEGKIITKGGLPSCACCAYPTLYVEYTKYTTVFDEPDNYSRLATTSYGVMNRSGPESSYEELSPDGEGGFFSISQLGWYYSAGKWKFDFDFGSALGPADITNPVGAYIDEDFPELDPLTYYPENDVEMLEAYVSLTPLP